MAAKRRAGVFGPPWPQCSRGRMVPLIVVAGHERQLQLAFLLNFRGLGVGTLVGEGVLMGYWEV